MGCGCSAETPRSRDVDLRSRWSGARTVSSADRQQILREAVDIGRRAEARRALQGGADSPHLLRWGRGDDPRGALLRLTARARALGGAALETEVFRAAERGALGLGRLQRGRLVTSYARDDAPPESGPRARVRRRKHKRTNENVSSLSPGSVYEIEWHLFGDPTEETDFAVYRVVDQARDGRYTLQPITRSRRRRELIYIYPHEIDRFERLSRSRS
jgi:hypothetical protein